MRRTPPKFHTPTWYEDALGPGPDFEPLEGERRARVAIIGAGLAGLNTARGLIDRSLDDIVVLEAGLPGEGASGRNGGFVFAGYSLDNRKLLHQIGPEQARCLHGWTREAVGLIRKRAAEMNCPVNEAGVLLADWFGDRGRLERFRDEMARELDFELQWVAREDIGGLVASERYGDGLLEPGTFHFNPLEYARKLASGIVEAGGRVHGMSPAESIARDRHGWLVTTPAGRVRCEKLVLSTGGYDRRLWPAAQRAIQPIASYIMVTEPLGEQIHACLPVPVAVYDTRFAFDYFRPLPDTRLLWGGRISIMDRKPAAIERLLRRDLARVFPALAGVGIGFSWGGWMSYARHQMPILRTAGDGLYLGIAFGGHGLATTTAGGEVLAEAITGQSDRLEAFGRWPDSWAGGAAGRLAVQGVYAAKIFQDRLRDWRGRPARPVL